MELPILDLVKKTVPCQFHHLVEDIFDTATDGSRDSYGGTDQQPKKINRWHDKLSSGKSQNDKRDETQKNLCDKRTSFIPLAIARVTMQLWSSRMFRHAEDLILSLAVKEKYVKERHLRFIRVYEEEVKEEDGAEWVIADHDEVIVKILWDVFNLKKYFDEVHRHRSFIQNSYDRLKAYLPELHPEIIERHDLSKYAFSQAIGYTLKFVHKTWDPIWKAACNLHLMNEPHHPQAWSKRFTPENKLEKIKSWTRVACDIEGNCAYGLDLASLSFDCENLPLPFLLESYVDMVAIEWERKKNQDPDISDSELIYMDEKYLMRYNSVQKKRIIELVNKVISIDQKSKSLKLSERELNLLSTISENDRDQFSFRLENQKTQELQRQRKKLAELDAKELTSSIESEEIKKKADNYSFYYNISYIITEVWDYQFRKFIENLILQKAVEEGYLNESHIKWVFFAEQCETNVVEPIEIKYDPAEYEGIVNLIWDDYNMREHYSQINKHRQWLMRCYQRLAKFVPELSEEIIERHDLSKFAFSQAVGYTLKWVHDINSLVWKKACELHLNREPHHPQMWQNRHTPAYKQKCLESFLCSQADENKYGIQFSLLDMTSENMGLSFLLESFLDMVAVEWERVKNGRDDISDSELVQMEERYLNRYSSSDKLYVKKFIEKIYEADKIDVKSSSYSQFLFSVKMNDT